MTIGFIGFRITLRDLAICRAVLSDLTIMNAALAATLREKLGRAIPVHDDDIDALTVTLNSRVDFSIDGDAPQRRILVGTTFRNGLVGLTLPLATPRGVALLGLRQGQSAIFEEAGRSHRIAVTRLFYQPEAAQRGHATPAQPPLNGNSVILDFTHARHARAGQQQPAGDAGLNAPRKGTHS